MWQTDTERSEALEQVGAERPDVLVDKNSASKGIPNLCKIYLRSLDILFDDVCLMSCLLDPIIFDLINTFDYLN